MEVLNILEGRRHVVGRGVCGNECEKLKLQNRLFQKYPTKIIFATTVVTSIR